MEILIKKVHVLVFFLSLNFYISQEAQAAIAKSYCGNIRIEEPFVSQNSTHSSFLKNMVFCRSDILYYTTSVGLFQVSSIDYKNKLLTVSHTSCSTSSHYVSPIDLSSGFPPTPKPNSLLLFNCLYPKGNTSTFQNCPYLKNEKDSSFFNLCKEGGSSSCLMVDDVQDLGNEFHPQDLNCSHYRRVYKSNSLDEKLELGTRISWDIDHVPNPCDECRKPYGNCGVGLRCLCHVTQCKVEVSAGPILKHSGIMLFSLLCLIVVMDVLEW
ncbi:PREDICTED: uncharacterized protein LOC109226933 [Nicotiana attenuata]|uniref:Wall-associated receptor kinase C-terminal domain-containing protein n=1 Tax=Nicotiana attenuata TaxID=49451 RepID=A0A1J6IAW3_NICAT|nr:PREDICTED: uncharacterized protein LOC109226933 [Nicotiana attenuata]OIT02157.1 hypothetical protein A4A49_38539 [Nicotiana attenuata]